MKKYNLSFYFNQALDHIYDGVYFVDNDRNILYWNKSAEIISGYSKNEIIGTKCTNNLLKHMNQDGCILCNNDCPLLDSIINNKINEEKVYLHHKDGYKIPILVRTVPVYNDDGDIIGAIEIFNEDTSDIAALEIIKDNDKNLFIDELTGLGNKKYIEITLRNRIMELNQNDWNFGVLLIDLDNFHKLNEILGSDIGDEVLKLMARGLKNEMRTYDFVGRLEDDKFIVIIINSSIDFIVETANKIKNVIGKTSFYTGKETIPITLSIGVTMGQKDDTIDSILERCDKLMKISKSEGGNKVTSG